MYKEKKHIPDALAVSLHLKITLLWTRFDGRVTLGSLLLLLYILLLLLLYILWTAADQLLFCTKLLKLIFFALPTLHTLFNVHKLL